jgi:hypothetical protein
MDVMIDIDLHLGRLPDRAGRLARPAFLEAVFLPRSEVYA